ncbi:MAG: hypothetical protein Q4C75_02790 [Bergeyella zoohelcum]|nr:hypothetical protein [Bergeyella zoohelcum]
MKLLLFLLAWVLFLPLSVLNYIILLSRRKARGYFLSSAVNLDRFGNYEFRTLFNATLRKKNGYEFGNFEETISSVLGKNQRDKTLTTTGKILAFILDTIDRDHCKKSIKELNQTL